MTSSPPDGSISLSSTLFSSGSSVRTLVPSAENERYPEETMRRQHRKNINHRPRTSRTSTQDIPSDLVHFKDALEARTRNLHVPIGRVRRPGKDFGVFSLSGKYERREKIRAEIEREGDKERQELESTAQKRKGEILALQAEIKNISKDLDSIDRQELEDSWQREESRPSRWTQVAPFLSSNQRIREAFVFKMRELEVKGKQRDERRAIANATIKETETKIADIQSTCSRLRSEIWDSRTLEIRMTDLEWADEHRRLWKAASAMWKPPEPCERWQDPPNRDRHRRESREERVTEFQAYQEALLKYPKYQIGRKWFYQPRACDHSSWELERNIRGQCHRCRDLAFQYVCRCSGCRSIVCLRCLRAMKQSALGPVEYLPLSTRERVDFSGPIDRVEERYWEYCD